MGLIDDYGKLLVLKRSYAAYNIWKLLNGRSDNLCIAFKGILEIGGRAGIVKNLDLSCLMFQAHYGILKLSVHDNTVSTDDDIVEDISVQGVMQ